MANYYIDLLRQFGGSNITDQQDNSPQDVGSMSNSPAAPHELPVMQPATDPGQAGYNPGGVPLSPILEQHDPDQTPKAVQAEFHNQPLLPVALKDDHPTSLHKRVQSDIAPAQQPSGLQQNVQRPRSQSVISLTNSTLSFDYTKPHIWLDKTVRQQQIAASPGSGETPLSRSISSTPASMRRSSSSFSADNGTLESPVRVHAALWNAMPNQITPTKQQTIGRSENSAKTISHPQDHSESAPAHPNWRSGQGYDESYIRPDESDVTVSPTGKGVDDLIRATGGLGIAHSPFDSSVTPSDTESDNLDNLNIAFKSNAGPTYQHREGKQREARDLAALIKSGALEPRNQLKSAAGPSGIVRPGSTSSHFFQQMHPVPAMTHVMPPPIDALVAYFRSNNGPSYEEMMNNMPLEDKCLMSVPIPSGVVHVSDIPYSTTRQEIVALFGRNARFVHQPANSPFYAIHIIMERSTGKSMDCFVEFQTPEDAIIAARRFVNQPRGRGPRLGHRAVTVTVVDPSVMMKELFPRAKFVEWQGFRPVLVPPPDDGFISSGFQGFVNNEELHMTIKLATDPKRSKYTTNHLQRTYESMISLLSKFPWHMTTYYTVAERDRIFHATLTIVDELVNQVQRGSHPEVLTPQLLSELLLVAHACPGFSDPQRALIVDRTFHLTGTPPIPLTELAPSMPFNRLTKKVGTSDELMKYLAEIIQRATTGGFQNIIPYNPHQMMLNPFGNFVTCPMGVNIPQMSMWNAANMEWSALDGLLQRTLHRSQI